MMLKHLRRFGPGVTGLFLSLLGAVDRAVAAPAIEISHHTPCNLFSTGDTVDFTASLKGFAAGQVQLSASVKDYLGQEVWIAKPTIATAADKTADVHLDVGRLECGYYELVIGGKDFAATEKVCFGVVRTIQRTAEEARRGNYRFGLKVFQVGDINWRPGATWNLAEAVDASAELGLQWTRHSFNQTPSTQPGYIATADLIAKHPMNVVLKVEGIPDEAYDADRYGPMDEYKAKHAKGWKRTTVPKREPYQAWLRQEIAKIPPEQNVFEIGNEVWSYMSAQEFAEWAQMVVPVIREMRPNAVIGLDPGGAKWGTQFIAAGGMKGIDMEVIHPYSLGVAPELKIRAWLRNRVEFAEEKIGHPLDAYITEYGWPTAPNDRRKQSVSERTQAQRTTRVSLMLYAEDCKTLIPHWMADREQDPTDRENWFGFFRLNGEPKPVVIAHAVCARMIDGSRFVGDLDMGFGVGAMLFEHNSVFTMALWTLDDEAGGSRSVSFENASKDVTTVDIMGRSGPIASADGKITAKVSGDVTYLVGVDPALAKRAVPHDRELNTETWTARAGTLPLAHARKRPVIDGSLADWADSKPVPLAQYGKSDKPVSDQEAAVYLSWDAQAVYVAARIAEGKGQHGGGIDLRLSTRPSRQLSYTSWSNYDYAFAIAPPSAKGGATFSIANCAWDKPLEIPAQGDSSGVSWKVVSNADSWTVEAAIPRSLLKNLPGHPGEKMSCFIEIDKPGDREKGRITNAPIDGAETLRWPLLVLQP